MCEGSGYRRECVRPAIFVKMHGGFINACYPKCGYHSSNSEELAIIPEMFL